MIKEDLIKILGEENVFQNEPMKKHTSFKTGGIADFFVIVNSEDELKDILKYIKENEIKNEVNNICKYLEDNILKKKLKPLFKEIELIING